MRGPTRSVVAVVLGLVPLVALAACSSNSDGGSSSKGSTATSTPDNGKKGSSADLTANPWNLVSYNAANGSAPATVQGRDAVLQFAKDGSVSGSTGCNNFAGTYKVSGSDLTITLGPMTRRACTDPGLNSQEQALTTGLGQVTGFSVDASSLTLKVGTTVRFTYAAEDNSLVGEWKVTGVNNGTGGLESSADIEQLSLKFSTDGTLEARWGCRKLVGDYSVRDGEQLSARLTGADTSACPDSAANEPEIDRWIAVSTRLSNAVEASTTYEVVGGTLTMRDAEGAMQVTATRD